MFNLSTAKSFATKVLGRSSLLVMKHSPEILMGVGVMGVVVSTVLACKATLHADEVIQDAKDNLERIHGLQTYVSEETYSKKDHVEDVVMVYTQTAVSFAKLYGPAVIVGAISIACLVGSHNVLSKRNAALLGAYKLIDESFKAYRRRVVNEYGPEKDHMFRHGIYETTETEVVTDEAGKKTKVKNTIRTFDPNAPSDYARIFNEDSPSWQKNVTLNEFFLKAQQNFANDTLNIRGYVFLNDIYDRLGFPRTKAGQIVGWWKDSPDGDGTIDFGLTSELFYINSEGMGINGYKKEYQTFFLDFNVDGPIMDLLR